MQSRSRLASETRQILYEINKPTESLATGNRKISGAAEEVSVPESVNTTLKLHRVTKGIIAIGGPPYRPSGPRGIPTNNRWNSPSGMIIPPRSFATGSSRSQPALGVFYPRPHLGGHRPEDAIVELGWGDMGWYADEQGRG